MIKSQALIFWTLLIALILLPVMSAQASMVPKNIYAPSQKMFMKKGRPVRMPVPETPYESAGMVVSYKAETWGGSAICVAQIKQADDRAFNAFVPLSDQPYIKIAQGTVICDILMDAYDSGKKVYIEGMITEHGYSDELGRLRIERVRYFNVSPSEETPAFTDYSTVGDDFGCIGGLCTLLGTIVQVDASVHRWKEWDTAHEEQATMCRATLRLPDDKIVKLSQSESSIGDLKKDDPGKLDELDEDPLGIQAKIDFDWPNYSKSLLIVVLNGVRNKFKDLMEDVAEDEHSYVGFAKVRTKAIMGCAALADALRSGSRVAVLGYSAAKGMMSCEYLIRYPVVPPDAEPEDEAISEDVEQYVFEGQIEAYGEDNDWAVGPTAF